MLAEDTGAQLNRISSETAMLAFAAPYLQELHTIAPLFDPPASRAQITKRLRDASVDTDTLDTFAQEQKRARIE